MSTPLTADNLAALAGTAKPSGDTLFAELDANGAKLPLEVSINPYMMNEHANTVLTATCSVLLACSLLTVCLECWLFTFAQSERLLCYLRDSTSLGCIWRIGFANF